MIYHRRKIILALLYKIGEPISLIQMQKLLFLYTCNEQEKKSFDFIPYLYGCFSFQASQDIFTLQTYGYVKLNGSSSHSLVHVTDKRDQAYNLDLFEQSYIQDIVEKYGHLSEVELLKLVYTQYPYYAINSVVAKQILTHEEMDRVNSLRQKENDMKLFTIGYEGLSIEEYLNKLIANDVHVLCDVRKNAFSQKFGFNKRQLEKVCKGIGIKYIHLPELGIESDKRQSLQSQADYDKLFDIYENSILPHKNNELLLIKGMLLEDRRVALTCFERDPKQCHRTRIANRLIDMMSNLPYKFI